MNSKISKSSLVSYIACSSYQPQLRKLDLNFKSKLWMDVLIFKDWSEVLALQLSCCQINDSSIDFLLSMDMPNLLQLDLSVNTVSAAGVQSLIKKLKHRLQILNLRNNQLTDSSVRHIFEAEIISQINLSDNRISAIGMSHILNESGETFKKLNLNNNPIGCKGVKLLIKANFPLLEQLRISKCRVGKEGLIHLVKSNWGCLLTLSTGSTDLQLDSLFLLVINNNWAKFTNLIDLDKVKQTARIGGILFENLLDEKKRISDFLFDKLYPKKVSKRIMLCKCCIFYCNDPHPEHGQCQKYKRLEQHIYSHSWIHKELNNVQLYPSILQISWNTYFPKRLQR